MAANDRQPGGDHYKKHGDTGEQHWDRAHRLRLDYFQAAATKYIERCWDKMGLQDIDKAIHYLEKYKELNAGRKGAMETVPLNTITRSMVEARALKVAARVSRSAVDDGDRRVAISELLVEHQFILPPPAR